MLKRLGYRKNPGSKTYSMGAGWIHLWRSENEIFVYSYEKNVKYLVSFLLEMAKNVRLGLLKYLVFSFPKKILWSGIFKEVWNRHFFELIWLAKSIGYDFWLAEKGGNFKCLRKILIERLLQQVYLVFDNSFYHTLGKLFKPCFLP